MFSKIFKGKQEKGKQENERKDNPTNSKRFDWVDEAIKEREEAEKSLFTPEVMHEAIKLVRRERQILKEMERCEYCNTLTDGGHQCELLVAMHKINETPLLPRESLYEFNRCNLDKCPLTIWENLR